MNRDTLVGIRLLSLERLLASLSRQPSIETYPAAFIADKPSASDLASTIGTWLAVGLGLFALIGVVGPLLVWRATQSERNKAISALEQGGGETFGYISRGLWTGSKVRVLRQVRAPLLHSEPNLGNGQNSLAPYHFQAVPAQGTRSGSKVKSDCKARPPSTSSSGWVQFGSIIEGYGIPLATGDNLTIKDNRTILPVHTSWLLLIGLLGRYGPWHDKGRLPLRIEHGISSTQATIATRFARSNRSQIQQQFDRTLPRPGGESSAPWIKSRAPWEDRRDRRSINKIPYKPLYGLNGTMSLPAKKPASRAGYSSPVTDEVFFSRHDTDRIGDLGTDGCLPSVLFWLAVGCIPSNTGGIICLGDVEDVPVLPAAPEIVLPQKSRPRYYHLDRAPGDRARPVRYENSHTSSESDDEVIISPRRHERSAAVFGTRPQGDHFSATPWDPNRSRAFCLAEWNERDNALSDLANVVHADSPDLKVLSLREVVLSAQELDEITEADNGTFFDRESPWIRLPPGHMGLRCLRRADAQLIGLALLTLDLSPHGYLMSCEPSACRDIFCYAAFESLPQLLTRTMWDIDALHLEGASKERLRTAMSRFYSLSQPIQRTRQYYSALYDLDQALQNAIQASSRRVEIGLLSLGCVMLTSPEFRSLIAQSARLLSEGFSGSIAINFDRGSVEVPTVMNFIARFPIDTDILFPDTGQNDLSGTLTVPLAKVILVCQRAALRSAMLDTALDSVPLFEAVRQLDEVVFVG